MIYAGRKEAVYNSNTYQEVRISLFLTSLIQEGNYNTRPHGIGSLRSEPDLYASRISRIRSLADSIPATISTVRSYATGNPYTDLNTWLYGQYGELKTGRKDTTTNLTQCRPDLAFRGIVQWCRFSPN